MPIYLYVKTHKTTGLKYLGKTERNPHKYRGSGVYWKQHLNKHGNNVETVILQECKNNEEIREWGLYYSKLWNVVESEEWANLKPEEGDGHSSETAKEITNRIEVRTKMSLGATKAQNRPEVRAKKSAIAKEVMNRPEVRSKLSVSLKEAMNRPEVRVKNSNRKREYQNRPEVRSNISIKQKEVTNRPEVRSKMSEAARKSWNRPEVRSKRIDQTIYHFIHEDGREEHTTQNDLKNRHNLPASNLNHLIRGRKKSCHGWRLIQI